MIAEVANEDGTIAAKDFFNLCKKVFKEDIDAMDEALANGEFKPFLQAKFNMIENHISCSILN